jgi:SAM-dependent methyltransferase
MGRIVMQVAVQAIPASTHRSAALAEWILTSLPAQSDVLDVGAGAGRSGFSKRMFESSRGMVLCGVDPDPAIQRNPYLHERYQATLEAFSLQCGTRRFDALYSHMVLEHVEEPTALVAAVWRLLKPGGSFFSVTPNLLHYFGMAGFVSERLGIQDRLLRRLRGNEKVDSYHFTAVYRMNTVWKVQSLFRQVGAARLDFKMLEQPYAFAKYLPRPFRFLPYAYGSTLYALRLYPLMSMLLFRAVKPR